MVHIKFLSTFLYKFKRVIILSFTAYNGLCIFEVHKPFSMSYPNAIEACRAELFTKKVELCDRYPQALVDNRFIALLAKKSVTAASSKSMTLKYFL